MEKMQYYDLEFNFFELGTLNFELFLQSMENGKLIVILDIMENGEVNRGRDVTRQPAS
jgi:hypothetical protein